MINQPHPFKDSTGMPWTLTALALSGIQFVLESADAPITIMARRVSITVDETKKPFPFVLELDDNASIEIDPAEIAKLDEFIQAVAA